MRRLVTSIRFEPQAVVVEFDEVWRNGLVRKQLLQIPMDTVEYLDEVQAVSTAIEALLDDVLEDAEAAAPLSADELMEMFSEEEDDDDGITFGGSGA